MAQQAKTRIEPAGELLKALLVLTRTVEQILLERAARIAANGPLPSSRINILKFLGFQGAQTSTKLSLFLGVSKPAVTQIVDGMIKDGLITRRRAKTDRREVYLHLTPKGRRLFQAMRREQLQVVRLALSSRQGRGQAAWLPTLQAITHSLVLADGAFEGFCLQCGAHEDDTCVLIGGHAKCQLRKSTTSRTSAEPTRKKTRSRGR